MGSGQFRAVQSLGLGRLDFRVELMAVRGSVKNRDSPPQLNTCFLRIAEEAAARF